MRPFSLVAALAIFPLPRCIADIQELDDEPIADLCNALTSEEAEAYDALAAEESEPITIRL